MLICCGALKGKYVGEKCCWMFNISFCKKICLIWYQKQMMFALKIYNHNKNHAFSIHFSLLLEKPFFVYFEVFRVSGKNVYPLCVFVVLILVIRSTEKEGKLNSHQYSIHLKFNLIFKEQTILSGLSNKKTKCLIE